MDSHGDEPAESRPETRSFDAEAARERRREIREPHPGEVLAGRYRVIRVLGRGGMGVVIEAEQIALGERVAVKLLRGGSDDATGAARLLREARIVASLGDGVVRTRDAGTLSDGSPYVAMDLLEGEDLARRLARFGPMPADTAIEILARVAEIMARAHAAGVVHRDLKPSNLFLRRRDDGTEEILVLDFGIAKLASTESEPSLTQSAAVLGSPLYMSPEQIRDARSIDARTDIWSLGVIAFELLAGTTPFHASTASATLAKIAADDVPLLRSLAPDAPESLERLVARCLAKDPASRFETMESLARALETRDGESLPSSPRWAPSRAVVVAASIGCALALSALGVRALSRPRNVSASSLSEAPVAIPPAPASEPSSSSAVAASGALPIPSTTASIASVARSTTVSRSNSHAAPAPLPRAPAVASAPISIAPPATVPDIERATEHRK